MPQKIVITGANSGIGLELLNLYASEQGHHIIAVDLADQQIQKLQKSHEKQSHITVILADLSSPEQNENMIRQIQSEFGYPDVFIANAGFAYYETFGDKGPDHIRKIYEVNVFSPIYSLSKMLESPTSLHFVFVASAMAKVGMPGYALYASTKAAIDKFSESFQLEKKQNITISTVYPVSTKTNFFHQSQSKSIPWPAQEAACVARKIKRGIERKQRNIYPSVLFGISTGLGRIQALVFEPYQIFYSKKLPK